MKIITNNEIEVVRSRRQKMSDACGCGGYSSLDGDDSSKVREFQVWASMNKGARLSADGVYGPLSKAAYSKWGEEWEKTQTKPSKTAVPDGTVTVKPGQTVSVYNVKSEPIKTVSAGEWVGTYFGERDKDSVYVNTTNGKGWVWKSGVNITSPKQKSSGPSPTPSLFKTSEKTKPNSGNESLITPTSAPEKKTLIQKWGSLKMPVKIGIIASGAIAMGIIIWAFLPGKKKK